MSDYKKLRHEAEQHYHQGRYEQAIAQLKEVLGKLSQQFEKKQVKD